MASKNPAKYFIRKDVQELLIKLAGFNLQKIFKPGFNPKQENSRLELLTTAQLENEQKKAITKAHYLLQMPPFLNARTRCDTPISNDEKLNPLNLKNTNYVFVDISMDIQHKNRMIVVREPNGLLRKADYNEREKMLQVYFPKEGKPNYIPTMFEPIQLEECLKLKNYLIVLNKACLCFEPNDPLFIKVSHRVYEYVNQVKDYDILYSTRFFGPLVFYLVWYKKLDNLLSHLLNKSNLEDCIRIIKLFLIVHEEKSKTKKLINETTLPLDLIKIFIANDLKQNSSAELAFKNYVDSLKPEQKAATNSL